MRIILNKDLEEVERNISYDASRSLHNIVNDGSTYGKTEIYAALNPIEKTNLSNFGLIGLVSYAYSYHKKLSLSPHDFWIMVMAELVKVVRKYPEVFRDLFTDSAEKKTILVESGSMTEMPMDVLSAYLSSAVKFDASIVLPEFTTNTPMVNEYFQGLFCDLSSPYYNYGMFCCGIKAIQLLGTEEDWRHLKESVDKLVEVFGSKHDGLSKYLKRVSLIFKNIYLTYDQDHAHWDFWESIFTQQNVGSGSQLIINGWITDLYYDVKDRKLENLTTNYAVVKYSQVQVDRNFIALYGGFNYKTDDDGFISLVYSKHIFEKQTVKK